MNHSMSLWMKCAVLLAALSLFGSGCASTPPEVQRQLDEEAKAQRDLGSDHLINGRTALAIRALQHSASINPKDSLTQLWLGEALRRKGHLEAARPAMEAAVKLKPDSHSSRLALSGLMVQMGDYDAAIEQLTLLADDPTMPFPWEALANRGFAHLKKGDLIHAREDLEASLEFRPDYWRAKLNLGIVAKAQGNFLEAARHLHDVEETAPREGAKAEANYRLAEIYVSLGQTRRAVERLQLAVEASPRGPWGKQSREYLSLLRGG